MGRRTLAVLAAQALVIALAGALLGLGVNAVRARRLPLVATSFDYQIRCEERTVESRDRTLTVGQVAALRGAPDVAIVDIRDAEAYARGHIPAARSVPVSVVLPTDPAKLAALSRFRQVIVYDESADLVRAEEFAGELAGAKVADVRFLGVGLQGWLAAGQPVSRGPQP